MTNNTNMTNNTHMTNMTNALLYLYNTMIQKNTTKKLKSLIKIGGQNGTRREISGC